MLTMVLEVIVDIATGVVHKDFVFQFKDKKGKKNGQKMTVIPEDPLQINILR